LVVVLGSDGQRLLVEVPNLSISSIGSLKSKVSVINQVKVLVSFHFRDDMEWSFNIETELFVKFSLSWFALPFISIDDVPLLVKSVGLVVYSNVSVFSINVSLNF
jgi:hypothetical protein